LKVPPTPAGPPRIEVRFVIDANGILQVRGKDSAAPNETKFEAIQNGLAQGISGSPELAGPPSERLGATEYGVL